MRNWIEIGLEIGLDWIFSDIGGIFSLSEGLTK
jgi:hypothetical protein